MGNKSELTFLRRRNRNGQETHEKSALLNLRGIQIKTTISYPRTPDRIAVPKDENPQLLATVGRKRSLTPC